MNRSASCHHWQNFSVKGHLRQSYLPGPGVPRPADVVARCVSSGGSHNHEPFAHETRETTRKNRRCPIRPERSTDVRSCAPRSLDRLGKDDGSPKVSRPPLGYTPDLSLKRIAANFCRPSPRYPARRFQFSSAGALHTGTNPKRLSCVSMSTCPRPITLKHVSHSQAR